MNMLESIRIALRSIRNNFLRSFLTLMIIAVGITCLVGILTAIDTILLSMSDSFNKLGANSFNIRPTYETVKGRRHGRRKRVADVISFEQAKRFKEQFENKGAQVSISVRCGANNLISNGDKKTNPTVMIDGVDENYLGVSSFDISEGRNFSKHEVNAGSYVAIIGEEILKKLFSGNEKEAVQNNIKINGKKYKVLATLASKGSSLNNSSDRRIFIPLENAKQLFVLPETNYQITASVENTALMVDAVSQATGVMRGVRKLKAYQENDFTINKSDGILNRLKEMTTEIRLASVLIALMTLMGASIGLMNIMLVSVTERTKEIGVRKALGAPKSAIVYQFLIEAVVICLVGGLVGIVLGLLMGYLVATFVGGSFIAPIEWMVLGIVVCIIVGIVSGIYPALKASRLDPVEALRYE